MLLCVLEVVEVVLKMLECVRYVLETVEVVLEELEGVLYFGGCEGCVVCVEDAGGCAGSKQKVRKYCI